MKDSTTVIQTFTHSIMAEFIDRYQVGVVDEYHVAVRCPLQSSRQDQAHILSKDEA